MVDGGLFDVSDYSVAISIFRFICVKESILVLILVDELVLFFGLNSTFFGLSSDGAKFFGLSSDGAKFFGLNGFRFKDGLKSSFFENK